MILAIIFAAFVIFSIYRDVNKTESMIDLYNKTRDHWHRERIKNIYLNKLLIKIVETAPAKLLTSPDSEIRGAAEDILKGKNIEVPINMTVSESDFKIEEDSKPALKVILGGKIK